MSTPKFSIIDAPTNLGLRPTGVERLPRALKEAGLSERLGATYAGLVPPLPYNAERDPETHILNPQAIHDYSITLANKVEAVIASGQTPLVLGGDCSVLLGNLLTLKRRGRYGLMFIDGHADFYQPTASTTGELADMDLAIVTGRGPDLLTNLEGRRPLVLDKDITAFGFRDIEEFTTYHSQDVRQTAICALDLDRVRALGLSQVLTLALQQVKAHTSGFWIHLDVDVLDDAIMPAVDYRMAGGLGWDELSQVLQTLMQAGGVMGMDITILNPALDPTGAIAKNLIECLATGLL
jgi:arginase